MKLNFSKPDISLNGLALSSNLLLILIPITIELIAPLKF